MGRPRSASVHPSQPGKRTCRPQSQVRHIPGPVGRLIRVHGQPGLGVPLALPHLPRAGDHPPVVHLGGQSVPALGRAALVAIDQRVGQRAVRSPHLHRAAAVAQSQIPVQIRDGRIRVRPPLAARVVAKAETEGGGLVGAPQAIPRRKGQRAGNGKSRRAPAPGQPPTGQPLHPKARIPQQKRLIRLPAHRAIDMRGRNHHVRRRRMNNRQKNHRVHPSTPSTGRGLNARRKQQTKK